MFKEKGFSLVELMIAIAIVGILSAVAIPSYKSHIINSAIPDAFVGLNDMATKAQQYYMNNKTYAGLSCSTSAQTTNYNFSCALDVASPSGGLTACPSRGANAAVLLGASNALAVQTATFCAIGKGKLAGYVYMMDTNGVKSTTQPSGGANNSGCWLKTTGGSC